MNITSQYNRFYHGVLLKQAFDAASDIQFREWKDTRTGTAFTVRKFEDYEDMDDLKQLFKLFDLDYPAEEDGKTSTRNISSKALHDHIEWVILILGQNGVSLRYIEEEWDRLLEKAGVIKYQHNTIEI
jgi:hypothetical protein